MKNLKRIACCSLCFFVNSYDHLESAETLKHGIMRRIRPTISGNPFYGFTSAYRINTTSYSTFKEDKVFGSKSHSQSTKTSKDPKELFEEFMTFMQTREGDRKNLKQPPLSEDQHPLGEITSIGGGNRYSKYNRSPAVLNPVNSKEVLNNTTLGEYPLNSNISKDAVFNRKMSQKVDDMKEYFINEITKFSDNKNINRKDLKSIIDLYTDLAHRPKDGVTKVLSGLTDTPKSGIYNDLQEHVRSKNSNLETYRKTYERLCSTLGEEVMQTIYRVAENIIKEKRHTIKLSKMKDSSNAGLEDYICYIVEMTHPLYPVQSSEVQAILELYTSLKNRPRDGVSKVLNGQTNTHKSGIYSEVQEHIRQKNSNLDIYRNIYARLSRSIDGKIIPTIYRIIDKNLMSKVDQVQSSQSNDLEGDWLDNESNCLEDSNQVLTSQIVKAAPKNQFIDKSSDSFLATSDGKYRISKKEEERLNRIYTLLPQYHGRSITGVLSGSTKNKNVPVRAAIQDAIDQIKQEAAMEGDPTIIDLDYFHKLHWSSMRVKGKGGSSEKDCPKEVSIISKASESNKEIKETFPATKSAGKNKEIKETFPATKSAGKNKKIKKAYTNKK